MILAFAAGALAGFWYCRHGLTLPSFRLGSSVHSLEGTGLLSDDCERVEVDQFSLPDGEAAVFATAQWMSEIIARGAQHPVVRLHAERAVSHVAPDDYPGQVDAVQNYLAARYRYVRDPEPVEYLQTPWWLLKCGAEDGRAMSGDCDDATMLSLSLLGAIGFPGWIEMVSQPPAEPGELNHVRGAVALPDGSVMRVDLTTRGKRRPQEYRVEIVEAAA
jgi:hypothetical protein